MAPFDVSFDRVETFEPQGGGPVVLKSTSGLAALRRFQRALGVSMTEAGLGEMVRSTFKPHVTLLYADDTVAAESIDPIRWTVKEFLLIHSVVGESRHIVLERWQLHDLQLKLGDW